MSNLKIRNITEQELSRIMKKGGFIIETGGGSHAKCIYKNQVTSIPFSGRKNSTVCPKIVKRVYEMMNLV